MNEHKDFDRLIRNAFDDMRVSEKRKEVFIVEPFYDRKKLLRISKEKKERKVIMVMTTLAVILFNYAMSFLLGVAAALPLWAVNLTAVLFIIVSLSVIILFYGLNKLHINHKEALYP
ncbi:hypothetical protein J3A84_01615 [Proteiniclasticum sp. SCR006]|uniref:Uncharacterized protein n=1 Tax=Proteiniclasticum aestuarii TaxID=2817862 RepID=A0A939H8S9_9CLOT|nr:hypothetical protein [Proteiniclasticum aestuarii]MBO1263740.1 hypothetical protein [Proteiniclasticum aestuarii]